jgi:Tfp pilus assembly protein PilN
MIKINLAAKKTSVAIDSTHTMTKLGRIKANVSDARDVPLRTVILHIAVIMGVYFFTGNWKTEKMKEAEKELEQQVSIKTEIEKELGKTKVYEAQKKALDDDLNTIKNKIEVLEKLMADRSALLQILLTVAKVIPNDVWISELESRLDEIKFRGFSYGFNQVSDFQKNLSETVFFRDVKVTSTKEVKDEATGADLASFDLVAKRKNETVQKSNVGG